MIEQSTLDFLKELKANNNRDWFNDHRLLYEAARDNFANFIEELIISLNKIDDFVSDANPKNSIFRIFKDVRFSKDKSPYKSHFSASISKGGRKSDYAGYYIHVEPENKTILASGIWHPQPAILKSVRNEISYNHQEYEKIIRNKKFVASFGQVEGNKLVRPPKGFDKEHPAIEYLKHKDFVVHHKVKDKEICQPSFKDYCVKKFEIAKPFSEYFRGPIYDVLENQE
tara:strand:+ start:463 stop:1143 length:681 start_codon:yes stop_codon:yes gene_type:complete